MRAVVIASRKKVSKEIRDLADARAKDIDVVNHLPNMVEMVLPELEEQLDLRIQPLSIPIQSGP